jgi:hypothetical protein
MHPLRGMTLQKVTIKCGRGDRIRTCDPLVPNQVRYQPAPLPDTRLPLGEAGLKVQAVSVWTAASGGRSRISAMCPGLSADDVYGRSVTFGAAPALRSDLVASLIPVRVL